MQKQISELQMIHLVPHYIKLKIPKDWEVVRLKKIVKSHNSGIFKNQEFYGEGENIVGVSDLYNHSKIDGQIFRLVMLTEEEKKDHVLEKGDLIYGESSLVRTGIGKSLYVTEKGEGTIFAWHTRRFKIDSKASPSFVYYMLDFEKIRNSIINRSTTTALTGVTTTDYFNTKILLPKKEEQQKIASILSIVDSLINQTQKEIEQTQRLKKGLMQKLLTKGIGHTKFKKVNYIYQRRVEIPEEWSYQPLSEIIELKNGFAFKSEFFVDQNNLVVITPGNFHKERRLYFNSRNTTFYDGPIPEGFVLENGDLLIVMTDLTREGVILGNAIILDSKYTILHNQRIAKVFFKKEINKEFLFNFLNTNFFKIQIKRTAAGSTVIHTSVDRILNCLIPIPSLDEQEKIVSKLSNLNLKFESFRKQKSYIETLKKGLMQKLLTGQIRVKV